MSERTSRRDFMSRVATVLAAAPFSGVLAACESLPPPTDAEAEAGRIAALRYPELAPLAWLGNVYLGELEDPLPTLDPLAMALNEAPDDDAALELLDARIQEDFAALRIHVLRGWTLGVTELQACALIARAMA